MASTSIVVDILARVGKIRASEITFDITFLQYDSDFDIDGKFSDFVGGGSRM